MDAHGEPPLRQRGLVACRAHTAVMERCENCEAELDGRGTPPWCSFEVSCEMGECHCFDPECGALPEGKRESHGQG